MRLLKAGIILWGLSWFVGVLIAYPANVFFLVIAGTALALLWLTVGSLDYWVWYFNLVYGNKDKSDEDE